MKNVELEFVGLGMCVWGGGCVWFSYVVVWLSTCDSGFVVVVIRLLCVAYFGCLVLKFCGCCVWYSQYGRVIMVVVVWFCGYQVVCIWWWLGRYVVLVISGCDGWLWYCGPVVVACGIGNVVVIGSNSSSMAVCFRYVVAVVWLWLW